MEDRVCIVTIDPKGTKLTVDLEGFHGEGCKSIAEAFDSIGSKVVDEDKPEMYEIYNQNVLHQRK